MEAIIAQTRDASVKAKQLRRKGIVPCVIYGAELDASLPIQLDQATARKLKRTKRNGSIVNIRLDEKLYHVLIKDMEYNVLNDEIVHISFLVMDKDTKYNSVADIVVLNRDSIAGILDLMQTQIPHAAKPEYLLDTVEVDLDGMPTGTTLTIGDIPALCSDEIELKADPGNIVLRIREKRQAGVRSGE